MCDADLTRTQLSLCCSQTLSPFVFFMSSVSFPSLISVIVDLVLHFLTFCPPFQTMRSLCFCLSPWTHLGSAICSSDGAKCSVQVILYISIHNSHFAQYFSVLVVQSVWFQSHKKSCTFKSINIEVIRCTKTLYVSLFFFICWWQILLEQLRNRLT